MSFNSAICNFMGEMLYKEEIEQDRKEVEKYRYMLNIDFKNLEILEQDCFAGEYDYMYVCGSQNRHTNLYKKLSKLFTLANDYRPVLETYVRTLTVDAISASKSKGPDRPKFKSIFEFGKSKIEKNDTEESLYNSIVARFNRDRIYRFTYYKYNDRVEWNNDDASHRFARLFYLNSKSESKYYMRGEIYIETINKKILEEISKEYHLFVINKDIQDFDNVLLFECLTFLTRNENCQVLAVKNGEVELINYLSKQDNKKVLNLTKRLYELTEMQEKNSLENKIDINKKLEKDEILI